MPLQVKTYLKKKLLKIIFKSGKKIKNCYDKKKKKFFNLSIS